MSSLRHEHVVGRHLYTEKALRFCFIWVLPLWAREEVTFSTRSVAEIVEYNFMWMKHTAAWDYITASVVDRVIWANSKDMNFLQNPISWTFHLHNISSSCSIILRFEEYAGEWLEKIVYSLFEKNIWKDLKLFRIWNKNLLWNKPHKSFHVFFTSGFYQNGVFISSRF